MPRPKGDQRETKGRTKSWSLLLQAFPTWSPVKSDQCPTHKQKQSLHPQVSHSLSSSPLQILFIKLKEQFLDYIIIYYFNFFLCIDFIGVTLLYNSVTHHLYIVLCAHHPKSGLLLSPFIPPLPSSTSPLPSFPLVITMLLSVSMRGFLFFCFCFCWIPSPFSLRPATLLPFDSCQSVLFKAQLGLAVKDRQRMVQICNLEGIIE